MSTTILHAWRTRFGTTSAPVMMVMAVLLAITIMAWTQPVHAAPLAGTSIGNQASATYTDASTVVRTATSNTVQTIVSQVASVSLTASQTKIGAAGGTVYFPHTLTNTGNGSDSFNLLPVDANTGSITFTNLAIYPDANGDGVPDSFTPITNSGALAAGASVPLIVAATISGASVNGDIETITLTATSIFTPAVTATNTDTVNVSGNAIVVMTKSITPGSGNPGAGPLMYTLTYTNTGNAPATALVITDVIPVGMTYNPGDKARWSVSGSTALSDATAVDAQPFGTYTIDYKYDGTSKTVTAAINQVLPGESRTLTFEVNVNTLATPGVISNTATFAFNDGSGPKTGSTNPTPFTVNQSANVVANGSNTSKLDDTAEPITVASALQGSTVTFNTYIWNTGNGSDSMDITVGNSDFPPGTSFVLYKFDGVTPLIDTNSNSTPDTGALPSLTFYNVVVKAILPANGINGPYSAKLTATSKLDNTKSNQAIMTLTLITGNTVDLTLITALAGSTPVGTAALANAASTGFGSGPEALALTPHNQTNPGTTTTFILKVNNTSDTSDTYNLTASTDKDFIAAVPLPIGWTVVFKADGGVGNCSTLGGVISNTGVINKLNNSTVCALVAVPANATAGTQNIFFRVLSPSSSAVDKLHGAIDVNAVRAITITNSQTGQVFPGGTVIYPMTVTNNGNVPEGTVASAGTPDGSTTSKVVLGIADSLAAQGWNSVIYYDLNGNGTIDPTDPVVSDLSFVSDGSAGLIPGESVHLLVKVFSPAGANIGDTDTATLTATTFGVISAPAPAVSSATNTSTVISGQVTLTKTQALDADCNNIPEGAFTQSNITAGAIPGACILYKITATNVGTAAINTLKISDATPANTVYATSCVGSTVAAATTTAGTITVPSGCDTGTVEATVTTLAPGATAIVIFGIKINP